MKLLVLISFHNIYIRDLVFLIPHSSFSPLETHKNTKRSQGAPTWIDGQVVADEIFEDEMTLRFIAAQLGRETMTDVEPSQRRFLDVFCFSFKWKGRFSKQKEPQNLHIYVWFCRRSSSCVLSQSQTLWCLFLQAAGCNLPFLCCVWLLRSLKLWVCIPSMGFTSMYIWATDFIWVILSSLRFDIGFVIWTCSSKNDNTLTKKR